MPKENYGLGEPCQGALLDPSLEVAEHKSVEELEVSWQDAPIWQVVAEEMDTGAGPPDNVDLDVGQYWACSHQKCFSLPSQHTRHQGQLAVSYRGSEDADGRALDQVHPGAKYIFQQPRSDFLPMSTEPLRETQLKNLSKKSSG